MYIITYYSLRSNKKTSTLTDFWNLVETYWTTTTEKRLISVLHVAYTKDFVSTNYLKKFPALKKPTVQLHSYTGGSRLTM